MDNTISTVLSIILSGLLATFVTILYQHISADKAAKRKIFETAVSYRYYLSEEQNVKALNSIEVVFHKNMKVRSAWKDFMAEANKPEDVPRDLDDKYIKLLEEMSIVCGYRDIKWDDLKKYYYPKGLSNKIAEDAVLRKLQIQTAEKDLVGQEKQQQNTPADSQLMLEILPKLIENPDSIEKLISFSEKVNNKK